MTLLNTELWWKMCVKQCFINCGCELDLNSVQKELSRFMTNLCRKSGNQTVPLLFLMTDEMETPSGHQENCSL